MQMILLYLIVVSLASVLPQRVIATPASHSFGWKNIQSEYQNPRDIKLIIINDDKQSVYFNPISESVGALAQIERWNESLNHWEPGRWRLCANGLRRDQPTELKPSQEMMLLPVGMAFVHPEGRKGFAIEGNPELRPLEGRYRFVVNYTFAPWVNTSNPDPVYEVTSPEFRIMP